MPKLTKSHIDKVVPPAAGEAFHWDTDLKGFGLRANAAGKSFIVQGRIGSGRTAPAARLTIGRYGVFTVDQARDVAREHLRSMRMGVDPRTANQRAGALRRTLREAATDYTRDRPLKPSSIEAINKLFEGEAPFAKFGWSNKPIASITRADVLTKFHEMKDGGAPIYANRTFGTLRALFNYAATEYVEKDGSPIFKDNPVNALHRKWSPTKASTSRIPDNKLAAVWKHLQHAREHAHQRTTLAAIDLVMFLLLTGCRISEAASLTWDRVNLDAGWWHIPDPKNSNPVWLPLPTQAIELLKKRPGRTADGYVFPTSRGHIKDPRKTMEHLSTVAGCELSPHDLRRTFTHVGVGLCRIEIAKVELLTNHVPQSVTARHYMDTQHLEYLKPEVQQIADRTTG